MGSKDLAAAISLISAGVRLSIENRTGRRVSLVLSMIGFFLRYV